MNERGQYGHGRPRLGYGAVVGAIYHSVGDRAEAVRRMASDWTALYQSLASQVGELTPDPVAPSGYHLTTQREWAASPPDGKKVQWWKSYAKPIFNSWVKFKSDQLGGDQLGALAAWAERWQTNWDLYEDWKKKLDNLRAEAQRRGFVINAPPAAELPTTIWSDVERGARDVAKGASDTWTFVKYAAWAALGIGAIVALSSVVQSMKAGRDPAEGYTRMFRRGGRAVARAALPVPLALSSGSVSTGDLS